MILTVPVLMSTLHASLVGATAEQRGIVKLGSLAVSGATVTITQGEKHFSTITDAYGLYSFPELTEGTWKLRVEMLCFVPLEREVRVGPAELASVLELQMLS